MGGFDETFYFGLYVRNLYSRFHDEAHNIYPLPQIIRLLHCRKRQGDGFRGLSLYVDITFGGTHADNAVINAVYSDIFPTRVFIRSEKTFVNTFAYDAYFSCFAYVHIINKAPVSHFLMLYLLIFRV